MSLLQDLFGRIDAMDWKKPYVWRLKISPSEFEALETAVAAGETAARPESAPYQRMTLARRNVVYLAEWYKRRYDGGGRGAATQPARGFDCQRLFEEAGVDKRNLFVTENGTKTWQQSIYVLGGVALKFECDKTDRAFLKELCKLYYGEEGDIDKLGGRDRATAFRESIRTRGCLYEYLQAVLSKDGKDKPFATEDLADPGSQVSRFVTCIEEANKAVLKSKYDLEWVIGFDAGAEFMSRKLRLVLKPESLGGVNHQYLGGGRVRQWGIDPSKCRRIVIGVRFRLGETTVCEPDFKHPILDYANTGSANAGYVAWGTDRRSRRVEVPVVRFDKVEIVALDDSDREHLIEDFKVIAWMQVFRDPDSFCEWTTRHAAQRDSALVCPLSCKIADLGQTAGIQQKCFHAKGGGVSEVYQWRRIHDRVSFTDEAGQPITLFNRQGYYQITVRLHHDVLRYQGGCVCRVVDCDGEEEDSLVPLVLGRDDLIVRHFETRNDLGELGEDGACERVEYLGSDRHYHEWTDTDVPPPGMVTLRLTVKGVFRPFEAYHLPIVIRRDCARHEIVVGDETLKDEIGRDGTPTDPVFHKSVGADGDFVSLEIWRATDHKEIIRDGRVVRYVEDGAVAEISYALRCGVTVCDFNAGGYYEYRCDDLFGIYALDEFSPVGDHHFSAYLTGAEVAADRLDSRAPSWLRVNLARKFAKTFGERLYYWNYCSDAVPAEVTDDSNCQGNDLVFHSLVGYGGLCVLSLDVPEANPFAFAEEAGDFDIVAAFEVATRHRLYYFLMQPLRDAWEHEGFAQLHRELMAKRNDILSEEDRQGLLRLAEEFGFDWRGKYGIKI